ncbi:hypothetical protein BDP55DRAFT_657235 [Colletotrichum godetiae]|uniref:Uncharacterized protein n=1 Tax=Colletotrichum godetiae TaxID=1209918 RepID=A0AAJ0AR54_9PEZI|nr:uncharacterized protein BDP55DRAFT_657235 [Colletotrichum godetiae]KAK1688238.1 hypothetical protein BDP55DRAFT_657235 [Colletotrichum godetiae]
MRTSPFVSYGNVSLWILQKFMIAGSKVPHCHFSYILSPFQPCLSPAYIVSPPSSPRKGIDNSNSLGNSIPKASSSETAQQRHCKRQEALQLQFMTFSNSRFQFIPWQCETTRDTCFLPCRGCL